MNKQLEVEMKRHLNDYRKIIGDTVIQEIYRKAKSLHGKQVLHISSTRQGGGVAEILKTLVPLMNDAGLKAEWCVLQGSNEFFTVTKKIHNVLQGNGMPLTLDEKTLYLEINKLFSRFTYVDHDYVIVHDPQPLPLIRFCEKNQPWIWRCHIDITCPNPELWDFIKTFIPCYNLMFISSKKYKKDDLPLEQRIVHPSIDPLSHKNKELSDTVIARILNKYTIPTDKPLITQVSRFDPWKDPEGVLKVFEEVKQKVDCRLVYCYNMAADDPEGILIYKKMKERAKTYLKNGNVLFVRGDDPLLVNALQRISTVILQKSLREGFGLTVCEAQWKETPVVASNVGGIPLQIIDGETGFLVNPRDISGTVDRIVEIFRNLSLAKKLGRKAKESVRHNFLITRLLSDYLDMMNTVLAEKKNAVIN